MRVSKIAFTINALLLSAVTFAGGPHWQEVTSGQLNKTKLFKDFPKTLNTTDIIEHKEHWFAAPLEDRFNQGLKVFVPKPNGKEIEFVIWESPIMENGLAEKFPHIKTFKGHQLGNPENSGRFDIVNGVFHGSYKLDEKSVFIDPVRNDVSSSVYQTYFKSDFMQSTKAKSAQKNFQCKVKGHQHSTLEHINKSFLKSSATPINLGDTLRTYRLAVATTGEYGAFFGTKEKAVASVVTAINRVNDVFQRDLAVKLELVTDNDKVVYIDPATDPFNGNDDGETLIGEVGPELNKTIGSANYDVGHVFSTGGGGLAGLGVVCGSFKAEGVTGSGRPTGDPFWIDYVAHELGHQFNAEHSFNATADSCQGNRAASWAYEPGSASTVMSYAGICGDENTQSNSDAYFHTTSIEQIKSHITGSADSCAAKSSLNNAIPSVNAGSDGFIPKETPFKLTVSATDANALDSLLYAWEQRDLGAASSSATTMVDDGKRPIFRSWGPSTTPTRYFPRLKEVLSAGSLVKGEAWPTTSRDLNFVATVRDQKGGINSDATLIKVSAAAGPFKAKFPTSSSHWAIGSKQYAQWDVANTTASPVSCATVDIKLSLDDGASFELIADGTANDGEELLTLPASKAGDKARFFVECSSQPFFAVTQAFKISRAGQADTEQPGSGGNSNNAPAAANDNYEIEQDSSNNRFDLLVNDRDQDGDALTISKVSNITDGATVTVSSDAQFVSYSPVTGFNGDASFEYELSDGKGGLNIASVSINVKATPVNQAPTATTDSFNIDHNSSNNSLDVLANDSDPDVGDTLTIKSVAAITDGATVTISFDGSSINYSPANNFSGNASFEYTLEDSKGATATAKVTITVAAAPTPVQPPASGGSGGGSASWLLLLLLLSAKRKRIL